MLSFTAQKRRNLEKQREKKALENDKIKKRVRKYTRMIEKPVLKEVSHYGLKISLRKADEEGTRSAIHAARAELIHLQEKPGKIETEGMEKTYKLTQEEIMESAPLAASRQYFDLKLNELGPYNINYSQSGRHLLLGGRKGHIASVDWQRKTIDCEIQVMETTRDIHYLHSEKFFAAAQKRCVYIYDSSGTEIHRIDKLESVNKLTFLPFHFLLVSANEFGVLGYLDVSIGQIVTQIRTRTGPLRTIAYNPYNAVIHLGQTNGVVSLWTPNMGKPVVKMLCHRAQVTGIKMDKSGRYMITTGMDSQMKVWDIRKYQPLHAYHTHRPAADLDISQRGLVAIGYGKHCEIWEDVFSNPDYHPPYLKQELKGQLQSIRYCPFEDCLGIGHSVGFSSIIVPGAGEPNIDALEANPFQTRKQRQEWEVKSLLEKIPADLITLDPHTIGGVDDASKDTLEKEKLETQANTTVRKIKLKQRGRSSASKLSTKKQRKKEITSREYRRQQVSEDHMKIKKKNRKIKVERKKSILDRFKSVSKH